MNYRKTYRFAFDSVKCDFTGGISVSTRKENYFNAIPNYLPCNLIHEFHVDLGFTYTKIAKLAKISRDVLNRIKSDERFEKGEFTMVEKYLMESEVKDHNKLQKEIAGYDIDKKTGKLICFTRIVDKRVDTIKGKKRVHPGWPIRIINPSMYVIKTLIQDEFLRNGLLWMTSEKTYNAIKACWLFNNLLFKCNDCNKDLLIHLLNRAFNYTNEDREFIGNYMKGRDWDRFWYLAAQFKKAKTI